MNIEPLESRIAPAAISVFYTDVDGDLVKITASKLGTVAPPLDAGDLSFVGGGSSGQLATLNLTDLGFDGAGIVFTVAKKPGGDGLAHVGFINAGGVDLERVVLKGDLGRIVAGDATTADDPGLNLLQVRTMGTLGLFTQGDAGDLTSTITGKLGALKVAGDFTDAGLSVTAATPADGQIGSIFIGGDLTGGVGDYSGGVFSSGTTGNVRIGGGVTGGVGFGSGEVVSAGAMGDVRIGGGLTGGAGNSSGEVASGGAMGDVRIGGSVAGVGNHSGQVVSAGAMGDVRIGGDLTGGVGNYSGQVFSGGTTGDVRIGGDLTGGVGVNSGLVSSTGAIGNVRIGGDLVGGSMGGVASLNDSGEISSLGRIASVTIGGWLIAGTNVSSATLTRCGAIVAGDDLGPVKIGGSILGNNENPALIIAKGQDVKPTSGFDTAIASLTVKGDARFAKILAGFDLDQNPANADASIGAVTVGHDWVACSLVAGAQDAGAAGFGVGDMLQGVGNTALIARIARITIKGDVNGSIVTGDNFGFVAQQIDKLRIGPRVFALTPGPSNDNVAVPFTDDVHLLEVL
jgi:hypothetical protein